MCYATECKAHIFDRTVSEFQSRGYADQSECIAGSITHFSIERVSGKRKLRYLNGSNQFIKLQIRFDVRRVSRQTMKIIKRNGSFTVFPLDVNGRIERRKRDAHIGWMRSNTLLRGSQNCMHPVEAVNCVATRIWVAFIAVRSRVVEVNAACALH